MSDKKDQNSPAVPPDAKRGPSGPLAPAAFTTTERLSNVDLLRGLVIVLMALDHVRFYFAATTFYPTDPTATDLGYFATRFVTHFCPPVFILLAGLSAGLYRHTRGVSTASLAYFLLTRGMWLVLIDLTLVSLAWQLFEYSVILFQVIWVIGVSMIILAGLVFLPSWAVLTVAAILILGHNLLDGISSEAAGNLSWLWQLVHERGFFQISFLPINGVVLYPLLPWMGVMAIGYLLTPLFVAPEKQRDRALLLLGIGCLLAFVLLRSFNLYGEPNPWIVQARGFSMTFVDYFDLTKYPPSLQLLLVTLGLPLLLVPLLTRWRGALAEKVMVFGRVPFFFYVVHLPFLHALSIIWQLLWYGEFTRLSINQDAWPEAYEPDLLRVYLVWIVAMVILYWPCKWFANVKQRRKDRWLSYL